MTTEDCMLCNHWKGLRHISWGLAGQEDQGCGEPDACGCTPSQGWGVPPPCHPCRRSSGAGSQGCRLQASYRKGPAGTHSHAPMGLEFVALTQQWLHHHWGMQLAVNCSDGFISHSPMGSGVPCNDFFLQQSLHFHWGVQLDVKCSDVFCILCIVMYFLAWLLMFVCGQRMVRCSCDIAGALCCIAVGIQCWC